MALNREQKRRLKKDGDIDENGEQVRTRKAPPKAPAPQEQRTTARVFVKEVRSELRKVAWPTRKETLNYSGIVAVALIFMTTLIFLMDSAFSKIILKMFGINT
jgi:preprotein translocase subunit SecE